MIKKIEHSLRTGRRSARSRGFAAASTLTIALGLLASASPLAAQDTGEGAPAAAQSSDGVILVTANRRTQSVTDVPYNITAVGGDSLATSGATSGSDLGKVVAGLGSFVSGAGDALGENNFTLRGLRADPAGQGLGARVTVNSVATYYGDAPVFFQVLLKDLERVEVLRGPQGTLYGSGAQGGAIRFIPNRPSFDGVSGEVNASAGITYSASQPNASVDGVINLPLADNLALRVSGAYVRQAGFIDQVNLFELDANGVPVPSIPGDLSSGPVIAPIQKNTNSSDQWMARAALRYQPTDWLDLEVSYLHQYTHGDDFTASNPAYLGGTREMSGGTYPNASYQTRPGGKYENTQPTLQSTTAELDLLTGTAAFDLGFAELTSVSSYYENKVRSDLEGSVNYISPFANFAAGYNHYPRFYDPYPVAIDDEGFTQEVRLVSQGDGPFSYVLGGYYQRQTKSIGAATYAPGLQAFSDSVCPGPVGICLAPGANPQLPGKLYAAQDDFVNSEIAAFGELSYQITDEWQVTAGARIFKNKSDISHYQTYPFYGAAYGDGVALPIAEGASFRSNSGSISDQVFKFNTSYEFVPDNMIYATFAQGFRRGGANAIPTTGPFASLPEHEIFEPDFADNYEIGIKGRVLDRRLNYSISAFLINQKGFQFTAYTPAFYQGVFNGELVRSKGLEIEGSFRVTPELTLSGSYVYTDAKAIGATVINDYASGAVADGTVDPGDIVVNPLATVADGAIMPGVSRHSAIAAIDYEIDLAGDSMVTLHANANYRSSQNNHIAEAFNPNFFVLPDVFMADARVTYDSGQGWAGSLFVTNLTNAVGYSGTSGVQTQNVAEPQSLIYASRLVSQPRTFGLSLHYGF